MEYPTKPTRSDIHLSPEAAAQIEADTKNYFDEAAPKRHTKPQRSEHSATYADTLSSLDDGPIPEFVEFQHLQKDDTQKLVVSGSKVEEEFKETEYYKDLNYVDKQHHTTGTGFIRVDDGENGKSFSLDPDSAAESHASSTGNPATNDWIPSPNETVAVDTGKPKRSG